MPLVCSMCILQMPRRNIWMKSNVSVNCFVFLWTGPPARAGRLLQCRNTLQCRDSTKKHGTFLVPTRHWSRGFRIPVNLEARRLLKSRTPPRLPPVSNLFCQIKREHRQNQRKLIMHQCQGQSRKRKLTDKVIMTTRRERRERRRRKENTNPRQKVSGLLGAVLLLATTMPQTDLSQRCQKKCSLAMFVTKVLPNRWRWTTTGNVTKESRTWTCRTWQAAKWFCWMENRCSFLPVLNCPSFLTPNWTSARSG